MSKITPEHPPSSKDDSLSQDSIDEHSPEFPLGSPLPERNTKGEGLEDKPSLSDMNSKSVDTESLSSESSESRSRSESELQNGDPKNVDDKRPESPLQEIPYISDLVVNATHAYHFAKTYHPKIEKSVSFIEDKSKTFYDRFSQTEIAQEKILPVMAKVMTGCVIFLTNAVNNCEELKEGKLSRKTDGAVAILKCFLIALWLEAKKELAAARVDLQPKFDNAKSGLTSGLTVMGENLTGKVTQAKTDLTEKVTEKVETTVELAKNYKEQAQLAAQEQVEKNIDVKKFQENYNKILDSVKNNYDFVKKNCSERCEQIYQVRDGAVAYVRGQMPAN